MKKLISFAAIAFMLICCLSMNVFAGDATMPFTDLNDGAWYIESIEYCYSNGYVNGMSQTTFEPEGTVTRAQVVTILANMSDYSAEDFANSTSFADVTLEQWFAPAVEWAYRNDVADGIGGGKFDPDSAVTREQLAMFLSNYLNYIGSYEAPTTTPIDSFTDASAVSGWAVTAMNWAVENGIISGYNNKLDPSDTATRAQLTKMIMMFDKSFNMNMDKIVLASGVKVSGAFSDNMLLQRDEQCSVWGWADESENGKYVKVTIDDKIAYGRVKNGSWKAVFDDTFPANGNGVSIYVETADETIEFKNVLFGDVYYVIGQSNVYYSMGELILDLRVKKLENTLKVDYDANRDIRFFRVSNTDYMTMTDEYAQGTATLYEDVYHGKDWMTPADVKESIDLHANYTPSHMDYARGNVSTEVFSALGYMFAYNMSNQTDVPIGVIEIDASGHPLITFAPNELAEKWGHDLLGVDGRYFYYLTDSFYNTELKSRYAYNQQLYPLSNFSCEGILWYQGESDLSNTREIFGAAYENTFADQFAELMTYYRNNFGNNDFKVYVIEFPSVFYNYGNNHFMDFGSVRTELGTIPQKLDDCYIVSSSDYFFDMGWRNNIHPYIKHKQAERLSDIALSAGNYNVEGFDINYKSGPVLDSVDYIDDNNIELNFNYVGDGLEIFDDTGEEMLVGIDILVNGNWIACNTAVIKDADTVEINYADGKIDGVRYNRAPEAVFRAQITLGNSERVPAVAFVDYR